MGLLKGEDPGTDAPTLAVRFPPIWSHIAPLASYVGAALEVRNRVDGAERVGIVVHELLENAVKYGDPASEVKLELFADAGQAIVVRVTNKAHPSRIAILERELRRTRQTPPYEAFARALERLQHLPEGSTMLGLARVALEATLSVQTTGGVVVVAAHIDTNARSSSNPNKAPVSSPGRAETPSLEPFSDGPQVSQTLPKVSDSSATIRATATGTPTRNTRRR